MRILRGIAQGLCVWQSSRWNCQRKPDSASNGLIIMRLMGRRMHGLLAVTSASAPRHSTAGGGIVYGGKVNINVFLEPSPTPSMRSITVCWKWVGEVYNPEAFDLADVDWALKRLR